MKGRNTQVSRIYKILTLLEGAPHGLSVADLTSRLTDRGFDVGKRTVYRDLEALKAAGFPLDEKGKSDDNGTKWTLERNTRVSHYLVLSARELIALYLARGVLSPLKDTPFFDDLQSTFDKIEDKLGEKSHSFLSEISQDFHFEPGPRWGLGLNPDITETIRAACTERHLLSVTYHSSSRGTTNERILGPHFLYFAKGSLYLVAEDRGDKQVKIFSVPRIQQAAMLDEEYQGQVVDPEQYFSSAFGIYRGKEPKTVKVKFAPAVALYIKERRWHDTQRVVVKDRGFIELTLEVDTTPELIQWILGFGPNAEVLEPAELVAEIQREAQKTIEVYQKRSEAG
jgi:predicted DNA-binding transcriptional regulator YafY